MANNVLNLQLLQSLSVCMYVCWDLDGYMSITFHIGVGVLDWGGGGENQ